MERKRARNRVAASKCRMRKLERIAVLDDQAKQLRAENEELIAFSERLKAQLYKLKQELRWHLNNGCKIGGSNLNGDQVNNKAISSPDSTTAKVSSSSSTSLAKDGDSKVKSEKACLPSEAPNHHLTPMGS